MKKAILAFIHDHPGCTKIDIEQNLNIYGIEIMKAIQELRRDAYIRMNVFPLEAENQTSHYYTATGKPFVDCETIREKSN